MAALTVLLVTVYAGSALGASGSTEAAEDRLPDSTDVLAGIELQGGETGLQDMTDPEAAEGVPLQDLQRKEALDLLNGVFRTPVEAAAGVYDELQGATLLGSHVAVLPGAGGTADDGEEPEVDPQEGTAPSSTSQGSSRDEAAEGLPEAEAREVEGPPPGSPEEVVDAALADSTVPLEVGEGETLDLSLQPQGGHLEPVAPLVETQIPTESGGMIELPKVGIGIGVEGLAEGRSASISGGSVAFYPNVAKDADLAISPTPTGVETMFQIRSAGSPDSTIYDLSLPTGAHLEETEAGGAEVRSGEEVLLSVPAPSAIDASGATVPVKLEADGSSLVLSVKPDAEAQLPILVDPLFQTYEWAAQNSSSGICSNSFQQEAFYQCNNREEWGYDIVSHYSPAHMAVGNHSFDTKSTPGLAAHAEQQQTAGDHAVILYTVPRFFKESPAPTSYIKSLKLSDVDWEALGPYASPYLQMGIWDSTASKWVSSFSHTGQVEHGIHDHAFVYEFSNPPPGVAEPNTHAKAAEVGIFATEATASSNATAYVGAATVELGDNESPETPKQTGVVPWVNQGNPSISFSATDTGLGVYSFSANTEEVDSQGNPLHTWKVRNGCVGVGDSACPRTWSSAIGYEPSTLPSGIDYLRLIAEDPIGNRSASGFAEVHVDHIAPTLALTGTLTEQDSLGTRRASYALKATAADGNAEHPQSGIARAEVKIDGKAVAMEGRQAEEWSPKCATQNCPLAAEWTLNSASVAEGKHTIEVVATDAVGISTTKTLTIETHSAAAPSLVSSGTMTEQATLGTSRPRYTLKAKSSALAAGSEAPTLGAPPAYTSSIGSTYGGANGQFRSPLDVAVDGAGNVWVLDYQLLSPPRLQEFNEKGEWLRTAGAEGAGAGQMNAPQAIAIDSKNNVWVADANNNRVVEFDEKGTFVEAFGTEVNKTKVEAGGSTAEKNLCTAASGNVCQAATAGSLSGQLKKPRGIAVTPTGSIWVVDSGNNRLEKFNSNGTVVSSVSGEGSEPGQLKEPSSITLAPDGSIWVTDTGNNRIEQWSSSLAFVRAVGKEGSGAGEFKAPAGIEADSTGAIWVADRKNTRIEEFDERGTYLQSFGTAGSGSGQFGSQGIMGLTVDAKGSIWITDSSHWKVQHWLIPGFPVYVSSLGSTYGGANGQFRAPQDVAADASGDVWVLDYQLLSPPRLQEFNEKGEWLRTVGSEGAGGGQLSAPRSLAIDSKNNLWVLDTGNNRVVEFDEKGQFIETFGAGVNKTKVEAGGTEAEKNLCTAASGNVCQAATAGSAAGQLKTPRGIALTAGGNIWVADTGNNRIEKFTPTGGLLNNLSGEGTEPGKLREPSSITVAPDGSIWVADTANNRIEQWNSSLAFVRAVGKEGSGGGEFKAPAAIEADSSGNIWVGDRENNRVEEFGEGGRYRGQLGASGSGNLSLSAIMGIAIDKTGSIWITDGGSGHYKVQKWSQEVPRSEITTILWIDGNQQVGLHGACKTASCTIEPQWTAESLALAAGSHTALVKTTDGLGRTTQSTVNFSIARDVTPPSLEVSGELFNAPEGWVEQKTYGLNATATDAGYGVTSIAFKIDGQQVASTSQACPDGGCKETLGKQISMASYSGGSHAAEVIATDGAGKTQVKRWTINVDPEGHISTSELADTLEAVEETAEVNLVGQASEEAIEGTAAGIGLTPTATGFEATGTEVPTTFPSSLSSGIHLEVLDDEAFAEACHPATEEQPGPVCSVVAPEETFEEEMLQPVSIVPVIGGATSATPIEGNAVIGANTETSADTVARPLFDGALTFQDIRDTAAPEDYEWEVHLLVGQSMKLLDPQDVEVYSASGHPAFSIRAQPASDAVGSTVPTTLTVNGNIITEHVAHRSGEFIYPVVSGIGWQGGFFSSEIQGPKDEQELREERERLEREAKEAVEDRAREEIEAELAELEEGGYWALRIAYQGAPEIRPDLEAPVLARQDTSVPNRTRAYRFNECRFSGGSELPFGPGDITKREANGTSQQCHGTYEEHNGTVSLVWAFAVHGVFHYKWNHYVWLHEPPVCSAPWGPKKAHTAEMRRASYR